MLERLKSTERFVSTPCGLDFDCRKDGPVGTFEHDAWVGHCVDYLLYVEDAREQLFLRIVVRLEICKFDHS